MGLLNVNRQHLRHLRQFLTLTAALRAAVVMENVQHCLDISRERGSGVADHVEDYRHAFGNLTDEIAEKRLTGTTQIKYLCIRANIALLCLRNGKQELRVESDLRMEILRTAAHKLNLLELLTDRSA